MERHGQSQWSSKEVARLLALVESDRRFYQQILAAVPVPLAILSADRMILTSNRAFRSMFHGTKESLAGKRIEDLVGSASRAQMVESIQDLQVHKVEVPDFALDLEGQQVRASLIALADWEDDSIQTLIVLQSAGEGLAASVPTQMPQARIVPTASPRRAAGEAVLSRKENGAAETSALAERQQLTAARAAALQGLAARLAHDLNNPLMIITGYAEEMLGAIPADDPHRADAEQILAATERISSITAQLLQFTRKQAKPPQRIDLSVLLRKLKPQIAEAAGNQVEVEITPSGAVNAMADAGQLQEVILALASSTRDDAKGRTNLKITCAPAELDEAMASTSLGPGRFARIALHDNGKGFDPEKSMGVFESILAKEKDRSAGPALARAYQFVREWGGDIAYTGEASIGTTFIVFLPLAEAEEEQFPRSTVVRKVPPAESQRPTVLVVDDEADIRSLIAKILRREKYNVLEAGSVSEGLAVATAHKGSLELLVSDVMLPDRSGRELAEQLRENLPALKVLYISGYTDDETVRSGARPAGAKFLQKPFTLGALLGKVREALQ